MNKKRANEFRLFYFFWPGRKEIVNNKAPPPHDLSCSNLVCTRDNADKQKNRSLGGRGKCFIRPGQKPMSCPWSVLLVVSRAQSQTGTNSHITHTHQHTYALAYTHLRAHTRTSVRQFYIFRPASRPVIIISTKLPAPPRPTVMAHTDATAVFPFLCCWKFVAQIIWRQRRKENILL